MLITKEQFLAYEKIRLSGVTNMWNVSLVSRLTRLPEDCLLEIMEKYTELVEKYLGKEENGG